MSPSTPDLWTRRWWCVTHLRSEDFFDVQRHPTILFRAAAAADATLRAGRYTVSGDLTIISQPVRLTVDVFGCAPDVLGKPVSACVPRPRCGESCEGSRGNAPAVGGGVALAQEVDLELDISLVRAGTGPHLAEAPILLG